ncbi:hypothetical protein [Paenibacillus soyae]|uniref:DUF3887 domain-containing protein n=1 Tax=Paenibacillus soyae TaxID=2969249 RepID=A0A9X2MLC6_9BACL|nr:hypothetical protein [Paenibacillus soyae]MCR2802315.1 hypothetical protein [Paenibacillus soyae]
MANVFLKVFCMLQLIFLVACNNVDLAEKNINEATTEESIHKDIRETAWNQLSSKDQKKIAGTWKNATVAEVKLTESMMTLIEDKSYEGKEVYLIDFPTTSMAEPNNMIVYIDKYTFKYIGHGPVD